MMITIENANEALVKAIKEVSKLYPKAKCKVKRKPSKALLQAIKEAKNGEVESYKDFKEFERAMLDEIRN